MPRPKRTKVAPSIPARGGAGRLKSPDLLDNVSDEGEQRAIGGKRVRGRSGNRARVLADDRSGATAGRFPMDSMPFPTLEEQRKRGEAAMGRLEAENHTSVQAASTSEDALSSPGVETGRRAISTPAAETSVLDIGIFRGRGRQTYILDRNASRSRSRSVESNLTESNGVTGTHVKENSALRGRFRRRQRQPSILGRANSRIRSSSVDYQMEIATPGNVDSVMGAGTFRSRSRQPSILGTRNTALHAAGEGDYYEDDDRSEDEDEDEFNPEDESTPLNLSKTVSTVEQGSQSTSSAVNPRKRKLSSLAAPISSPRLPAYVSEAESDSPSSPSRFSVAEEAAPPVTPERLSDVMAPPRSSSPAAAASEVLLPSRRTTVQPYIRSARRQPARRPLEPPNSDSLPSSPPSLTHSPNQAIPSAKRQVRGRARTRPQPADYSTIQLQALLPRRRRRRAARDPFEIESSDDTEVDLGSDEDELTHLSTRSTRPGTSNRRITRLKPGPQSKATPLSKAAPTSKPRRRTTTTTTSDKENQPATDPDRQESDEVFHSDDDIDPDDSLAPLPEPSSNAGEGDAAQQENSQELEARVGKELKNAKRKFEVVDRWELEFEDCTGSSSPWDGR